ncbi:uncharacterized protein LOC103505402 [Diaphorina citri]|uniref:nicotinamidase n=1 Tax=Diaphorina citri TaxID=121845 RepID=A0A3Q0IQC7_DIACI|nr:uncharacterized protein LOC103505402 [Diaphorina citri]
MIDRLDPVGNGIKRGSCRFMSSSLPSFDVTPSLEMDACFTAFDKDGFDLNQDGLIDREEFAFCWNRWIKVIVRPNSALLVIDVQNDFISGTLNLSQCSAKQNGLQVIEPINKLLDTVNFNAVFYSLDWHPSNHVSFIDNIKLRKIHHTSTIQPEDAQTYDTVVFDGDTPIRQRLWPRHCVQDSWGAELHKDLKVVDNAIKVYKGTDPEVDSYSVFWDNKKLKGTSLAKQLEAKKVTDVYVCGLAYDVCVGASAIDAITIGYRTILIEDCCRGVDMDDMERTRNTILENYGSCVQSDEVSPPCITHPILEPYIRLMWSVS